MKKHVNIPIFVADRGCKNVCVFCNQKKITNTIEPVTASKAQEIIEASLKTADIAPEMIEIAFFGGSFSGIPVREQQELLALAQSYKMQNRVGGIRLSTRPDLIDKEVIERFLNYSVTAVELGAQSMDDNVLIKSGRGHTADDTRRAACLIKNAGIELGLQMMIGLPGDTFETTIFTAQQIIALKPQTTRIYPTVVIKDTTLHEMMLSGEYTPLSVEDAVIRCAALVRMFENAGIKILRIGLMASENLCDDKELAGGAFHPSLGELVKSKIMLDKAFETIEDLRCSKDGIVITVNPKDRSVISGNKKSNISAITQKYGFSRIVIEQSGQVKQGTIKILPIKHP